MQGCLGWLDEGLTCWIIICRGGNGLGVLAFTQALFPGPEGGSLADDGIVTSGAGGEARDLMGGSGCLSLLCMGTDSFEGGCLMGEGGEGGLKSSRMLRTGFSRCDCWYLFAEEFTVG